MHEHRAPHRGWWRLVPAATALLLAVAVLRPTYGQETDLDLQGKVLQRSDGTLYVVKDGWKYRVDVAQVDDSVIDALPEMDFSVGQLDQLFAVVAPQPAPPTDAPPAEPPPVVVPPPPSPPTPVPVIPGPYIAVANPVPGDAISIGGLDMQGKAFDPTASVDQGTGVDRVQVFLEDRDRGGLLLGDARLGRRNPAAEAGSQFAQAGWDIVVNLPPGQHVLYCYARSSVTGKESAVTIPVRVGVGA